MCKNILYNIYHLIYKFFDRLSFRTKKIESNQAMCDLVPNSILDSFIPFVLPESNTRVRFYNVREIASDKSPANFPKSRGFQPCDGDLSLQYMIEDEDEDEDEDEYVKIDRKLSDF